MQPKSNDYQQNNKIWNNSITNEFIHKSNHLNHGNNIETIEKENVIIDNSINSMEYWPKDFKISSLHIQSNEYNSKESFINSDSIDNSFLYLPKDFDSRLINAPKTESYIQVDMDEFDIQEPDLFQFNSMNDQTSFHSSLIQTNPINSIIDSETNRSSIAIQQSESLIFDDLFPEREFNSGIDVGVGIEYDPNNIYLNDFRDFKNIFPSDKQFCNQNNHIEKRGSNEFTIQTTSTSISPQFNLNPAYVVNNEKKFISQKLNLLPITTNVINSSLESNVIHISNVNIGIQNSLTSNPLKRKRSLLTFTDIHENRTAGTQTSLTLDPISMKTQSTQTLINNKKKSLRINKSIQTKNQLKDSFIQSNGLPDFFKEILINKDTSNNIHPNQMEYFTLFRLIGGVLTNYDSIKSTTAVLQCWSSNNLYRLPVLIREKYYHSKMIFENQNIWFSKVSLLDKTNYSNIKLSYNSPIHQCIGKEVFLHCNIIVFNPYNGKIVTSNDAKNSPFLFVEIQNDIRFELKENVEISFSFKFQDSFQKTTFLKSTQELKNCLIKITFNLISRVGNEEQKFSILSSINFTFKPKSKIIGDTEKFKSLNYLLKDQIPYKQSNLQNISTDLNFKLINAITLSFITHANLSESKISDIELKYILYRHCSTLQILILNGCKNICGLVSTSDNEKETTFPTNIHILRVKNVPIVREALLLMSKTFLNLDWNLVFEDLGLKSNIDFIK